MRVARNVPTKRIQASIKFFYPQNAPMGHDALSETASGSGLGLGA